VVDSHCHVDLCANPIAVAREAEKLKIATVPVTYLPSHFELAEQRLRRFKYVRPTLGPHPMAAKEHRQELPKFLALVAARTTDRRNRTRSLGPGLINLGAEVHAKKVASLIEEAAQRARVVSAQ
jgi:Tat protein secretion system quality control protein TatD with DNase activity